jgi:hypothetical protein
MYVYSTGMHSIVHTHMHMHLVIPRRSSRCLHAAGVFKMSTRCSPLVCTEYILMTRTATMRRSRTPWLQSRPHQRGCYARGARTARKIRLSLKASKRGFSIPHRHLSLQRLSHSTNTTCSSSAVQKLSKKGAAFSGQKPTSETLVEELKL